MTLLSLTNPALVGDALTSGDALLVGHVRSGARRAHGATHPRDLHLLSNVMGALDEGTLAQYATALVRLCALDEARWHLGRLGQAAAIVALHPQTCPADRVRAVMAAHLLGSPPGGTASLGRGRHPERLEWSAVSTLAMALAGPDPTEAVFSVPVPDLLELAEGTYERRVLASHHVRAGLEHRGCVLQGEVVGVMEQTFQGTFGELLTASRAIALA